MIDSPIKRLASVALVATLVLGACSSSGGSAAPSTAATTAASAAGSTAASAAASAPSSASGSTASASAMAGESAAAAASGSAAGSMPTPPPVPTGNISLQGAGRHLPGTALRRLVPDVHRRELEHQDRLPGQRLGSRASRPSPSRRSTSGPLTHAMKDAEVAAIKSGLKVLHIPTALGAVVVIFNVPGVDKLQLDSANVAGHLPRHDHQVERPGDRRRTTRASRSRTRPSPSSIGRTARERRTRSRPTSIR